MRCADLEPQMLQRASPVPMYRVQVLEKRVDADRFLSLDADFPVAAALPATTVTEDTAPFRIHVPVSQRLTLIKDEDGSRACAHQ